MKKNIFLNVIFVFLAHASVYLLVLITFRLIPLSCGETRSEMQNSCKVEEEGAHLPSSPRPQKTKKSHYQDTDKMQWFPLGVGSRS